MFTLRCAAQHESGQFATLSVQLPSVHTGGALVVRHGSKEWTRELGANDGSSEFACHFAVRCPRSSRPRARAHTHALSEK